MVKRYGLASVVNAINTMSEWSFTPEDVINTLEKQAQKHITPDDTTDVAKKIAGLTE